MAEFIETLTTGGLISLVRMKYKLSAEGLASKLDLPWGKLIAIEAGEAEAKDSLRSQLEGMLVKSETPSKVTSDKAK